MGIHATGFKELHLKPELLQAITDCGFEHPSEGKTRSSLHQPLEETAGTDVCLVWAFCVQSSTSASLMPSWGWTCCAKPSQEWARQLCSSSPSFSSLSPSRERCRPLSCATPVS